MSELGKTNVIAYGHLYTKTFSCFSWKQREFPCARRQ